ncbi:MAG TPA: hypothetical protein VHK01_06955 [Lacipirellulaceae bacterium]|jgi:hypothetical protein|nr:hypothetical protein [Lacipirellulaceae bacterium]
MNRALTAQILAALLVASTVAGITEFLEVIVFQDSTSTVKILGRIVVIWTIFLALRVRFPFLERILNPTR